MRKCAPKFADLFNANVDTTHSSRKMADPHQVAALLDIVIPPSRCNGVLSSTGGVGVDVERECGIVIINTVQKIVSVAVEAGKEVWNEILSNLRVVLEQWWLNRDAGPVMSRNLLIRTDLDIVEDFEVRIPLHHGVFESVILGNFVVQEVEKFELTKLPSPTNDVLVIFDLIVRKVEMLESGKVLGEN